MIAASTIFDRVDIAITMPRIGNVDYWSPPDHCRFTNPRPGGWMTTNIACLGASILTGKSLNYSYGVVNRINPRGRLPSQKYDLAIFDTIRTAYLANSVNSEAKILHLEDVLSDRYARESELSSGQIFGAASDRVPLGRYIKGPIVPRLYNREARKLYMDEISSSSSFDLVTLSSPEEARTWSSRFRRTQVRWAPIATPTASRLSNQGRKNERKQSSLARKLVFLGTLSYHPNVRSLDRVILEIFPHIRRLYPELKLEVVGACLPSIQTARQGEDVVFHGYVDDLEPFLNQTSCLIMPSSEPGGIKVKLIEALLAGSTVLTDPDIATATGLLGKSDSLVECRCVEEYVAAVTDFMSSDPDELAILAAQSSKTTSDIYGEEAVRSRLSDLILEAIS
ncbi:MAG: glycosyltransferase family 4 protein [Acidimicrobiales bacterium]